MSDETFLLRPAVAGDVDSLARLHVDAFVETHGGSGPTFLTRAWQWREAFAQTDPEWFCFVMTAPSGGLVGFAKGQPNTDLESLYAGELNKIYLLRAFHRRGLGTRLVSRVAREFLARGIGSMLLFGDAANPSNAFYEALGAKRLYAGSGEFHGAYGWRDLRALAARSTDR